MSGNGKTSLMQHFSGLEDPRRPQGRRHNLLDIIAMTICAVVAGAEGWDDVELFAQCKEDWFGAFLELPNGIPCSDTFARVFARLDPDRFRECFTQWVSHIHRLTRGQVAAIDRKTVRRSHDRRAGREAIHMVSAWASENCLALGQTRTDAKSNEITVIPRLLEMLELKVCIVTIDAMGCQKEISQTILECGADYVLAVKGNQGRLYQDIGDLFQAGDGTGVNDLPHDYAATLNKGHGRIERRECWTIGGPACLEYLSAAGDWPGLRSVGMVRSEGGRERRYRWRRVTTSPAWNRRPRGCWGRQGVIKESLGHREFGPLGAGCVLPGGREPGENGKRAGEPGNNATRGAEPLAARSPVQNLNQGQAKTGRMGQHLPDLYPLKLECVGLGPGHS